MVDKVPTAEEFAAMEEAEAIAMAEARAEAVRLNEEILQRAHYKPDMDTAFRGCDVDHAPEEDFGHEG